MKLTWLCSSLLHGSLEWESDLLKVMKKTESPHVPGAGGLGSSAHSPHPRLMGQAPHVGLLGR